MNHLIFKNKFNTAVTDLKLGFIHANNKCKYLLTALVAVLMNTQSAFCATIWDQSVAAGDSFLTYLSTIYYKWWWIAALISAIIWVLSKDDKVKTAAKRTTIGLAVVYIVFHLGNVIESSLNALATDWGGTTN